MTDIEEISGEDKFTIKFNEVYVPFVLDLLNFTEKDNWGRFQTALLKKYRFKSIPRRIEISYIYETLLRQGKIQRNKALEGKIVTKQSCSMSGVLVVTVATKPDKFSCKYNCLYCPNEPGQPRSYLSDEPVLTHAVKCDFDAVKQFHRRANILYHMEHKLDKLEVIVVGGTWSCYDHAYQEEFIRDLYYASNVFYDTLDGNPIREKLDMRTEKMMKETAQCRIISLTLETRPDCITVDEIKRFRDYGVTKVQIGVQQIYNDVLDYVNRRCSRDDIIRAIKLLTSNFFKVDAHYMPNLPGSTPEKDIAMFKEIVENPEFHVDQWKIYPCAVMPYTTIKTWYENGTYVPYPEEKLKEVIKYAIANAPYYVRINRVVRDFTAASIIGGLETLDMRDIIQRELISEGIICQEIRSREVKTKVFDENDIELIVRKYEGSGGIEYFISHETHDRKTLYSLLRLRINNPENDMCVYPEMREWAAIREIHVYGSMIQHDEETTDSATQHKGLGKELIQKAIDIATEHGYHKLAVISGEGVRGYYKKQGFVDAVGGYLVKQI